MTINNNKQDFYNSAKSHFNEEDSSNSIRIKTN